MNSPLVHASSQKFLARKKVLALLGAEFEILTPDEQLAFFVKQKAFKLKESIKVYRDRNQTDLALSIAARSIMDFSGTYDVTTPSGEKIGALKREGLSSILRDKWLILNASDQPVGQIEEDSMLFAMLRRFLSNLVPQTFHATMNGQMVAEFKQHFNPFIAKYDIDFSHDTQKQLDQRLGIAAVVLLLAIEGRQQ